MEMKWKKNRAPRRSALFIPQRNPRCLWSSLLFRLLSVAGLDTCVVQADEIFAVLIGLKTEFQRFFRRGLRLRPVRIREARVRVFPEIARGVQKDGGAVN